MSLRLSDQLCFPLYAATRAVQQRYRPLLEPLGLTYPQYLVMLVLWEGDGLSVQDLGERLFLDAGTLSPLLRRLEAAGLVRRDRSDPDGRVVRLTLTPEGRALEARAAGVPEALVAALPETDLDLPTLKRTLDALLKTLTEPR